MVDRLARLVLADLCYPPTARAAAEVLLGPAREVARHAIGASAARAADGLLVASDATPDAVDHACAWFAAREWLRGRGEEDSALTLALAEALRDEISPASGVRRSA